MAKRTHVGTEDKHGRTRTLDSANLTRPKAHLCAHAHSVTGVQGTGDNLGRPAVLAARGNLRVLQSPVFALTLPPQPRPEAQGGGAAGSSGARSIVRATRRPCQRT